MNEDKSTSEAFMQLAVLGLTLLGVEEMAPMILDPEGGPVGVMQELSKDSIGSAIRHIPWEKVAVIASLIPVSLHYANKFLRRIPKKVVQRVDVEGSRRVLPDSDREGFTESSAWPDQIRESDIARTRQIATYEGRWAHSNGQDEYAPDNHVLPMQPTDTGTVSNTHHRPQRGVVLSLAERAARKRNSGDNRRRKKVTRRRGKNHERTPETD